MPEILAPSEQSLLVYERLRFDSPIPNWWIGIPDSVGWWRHRTNGLRVIETVNIERDDRHWHHVSVSRVSRLPSWDDLKLVRADFIGDSRECYSVFAPIARWVNTYPFALHLWCCVDSPDGVLPDFRHLGQI